MRFPFGNWIFYFALRLLNYDLINCTFRVRINYSRDSFRTLRKMLCFISWGRQGFGKDMSRNLKTTQFREAATLVRAWWTRGWGGREGKGREVISVRRHLLPLAHRFSCMHPGSFPHSYDTWPCLAWAETPEEHKERFQFLWVKHK